MSKKKKKIQHKPLWKEEMKKVIGGAKKGHDHGMQSRPEMKHRRGNTG